MRPPHFPLFADTGKNETKRAIRKKVDMNSKERCVKVLQGNTDDYYYIKSKFAIYLYA